MGNSRRPRSTKVENCDGEESRRSIVRASSQDQDRQSCRISCCVFLVSLCLCLLDSKWFLVRLNVNAEEFSPYSIPSNSVYPSTVSKSMARIVIPSSSNHDEDGIGDGDEFDITEDSFPQTFSNNIRDPLSGLLFGEETFHGKNSRKLSPLFSTPSVRVHRCSIHDPFSGDNEEDGYGNSIPKSGASSISAPSRSSFKKTGTTIAGCVVPGVDGVSGPYVVLAADTRATSGTIVADKRCDKIHKLASNCRCCGAGTSADLDKVTRQVLYQMALLELQSSGIGNRNTNTDDRNSSASATSELLYPEYGDENDDDIEPLLWMRPVSIDVMCGIFQDKLFRSGGQVGANLIVGGVWKRRAYLRAIHPHGSTDVDLPFTALGSGGLAAMAILEEGYRSSLTLQDGIKLVQRAILSGIRNDLGSGSQVDLCVIDPDGVCRQIRGVIPEEELLPDGDADGDSDNRTNRLLELLSRGISNGDQDQIEKSRSGANTDVKNVGVNGFGNQPFAINSMKQRMVSVVKDKAEQEKIWDRFLGL